MASGRVRHDYYILAKTSLLVPVLLSDLENLSIFWGLTLLLHQTLEKFCHPRKTEKFCQKLWYLN